MSTSKEAHTNQVSTNEVRGGGESRVRWESRIRGESGIGVKVMNLSLIKSVDESREFGNRVDHEALSKHP